MINSSQKERKNRFRVYNGIPSAPIKEHISKNRKITHVEAEPIKKNFKYPSISLPTVNIRSHTSVILKGLYIVFCFCITTLLLVGGGYSFTQIWKYCLTSEFFNIKELTVEGNKTVSTEEILELSGINTGKNIFLLDIQKNVWDILRNPWIENASLTRILPDTIKIRVSERVPSFCTHKDKSLYFINEQGQIIAEVTPKNYRPLPILEIGPGGEEILSLVTKFIEEFGQTNFPFDIKEISMIRISAGRGFELYWENKKLNLSIGTENWKDNMKRLAVVINDIEKRNETLLVTGIRSSDGQVWMTKKGEAPSLPPE